MSGPTGALGEPAGVDPYDAVPYPGHPYPQTHPDRLAVLATLFGLEPPPLEHCRVLELGCGDAGNLVPMALALPKARFLGIDAAPQAVARGRALADALGLSNLELGARPLDEVELGAQRFDYVIAHGFYSWVAAPVRDRLLSLCREALSEQGVAYVSYNALPGGRLRQVLRDMLAFHTASFEPPAERIQHARDLLRLLVEGWSEQHEFGAIMRRQAERLLERGDETLFHDELAPVNEPIYFHEFAAHAGRHRLQYLAEADFFEMQIGTLPDPVAAALHGVEDPLRREQYLDFLKGRMFRQTLLCRAELPLDPQPRPAVLERMAAAGPVRDLGAGSDRKRSFEGPSGSTLTTDHPLVSRALELLGRSWPAAVWVRELAPKAASAAERDSLCDALLRCYAGNVVQLHVHPPELAASAGERPEASPLARHQARHGGLVTNLRHTSVRIEDELGRRLVTLLDGRRDRAALRAELSAGLQQLKRGIPPDLDAGLDRSLQGLARLALLRR